MTDKHTHIYKQFDSELSALKDRDPAMGGMVEAHIVEAMKALTERSPALAEAVIDGDAAVNALEVAIDEQCIRMLALRQPAAGDLRFIAAALKIVTDLERIGDLAVNMAERAIAIAGEPPLAVNAGLPRMATAAQKMLADALDAFVTRDVAKANAVLEADDLIDELLVQVFAQVTAEMARTPSAITAGISTLFFAKHIERLADHTTNLAEMVVYLARGKDVRHNRTR